MEFTSKGTVEDPGLSRSCKGWASNLLRLVNKHRGVPADSLEFFHWFSKPASPGQFVGATPKNGEVTIVGTKNKVLCAARRYLRWGWQVVPIPHREKAPRLKEWQKLRLEESDLHHYFHDGDCVGVLLGKPSKRLTDTDLDCLEAIFLAPNFLPETGRIFGHKSKPDSHYLYYSKSTLEPEKFADVDGTTLVEIRSTGQQTVLPPSIHPSGERIRWRSKHRPARVKASRLRNAVKRLAAATLLARHWPKRGSRNEAALALAGMLLRAEWEDNEAAEFVQLIAQAADDEEWRDRKNAALGTRKRLDKKADATGRPKLAELLGADVVERACDWLGISRAEVATHRTARKRVPWPEPLSQKAFYGLAGDAVRMIAPESEADPAALLVQILIAFGSAVGRGPHFEVEAAKHGTNLFGLIVGRTAKARKGTAWSHVLRIFREVDASWCEKCLASGLSSGEGVIHAVRDATEKRKRTRKNKAQDDEEVVVEEADGVEDKRLMVVEAEFAGPLRAQRREGNTLSAQLRQAWDTGNLRVLTKNSPVQTTDAHISIIGHITREELRRELTVTDEANGFANRFLFTCSKRSKLLPLGGNINSKVLEELAYKFSRAAKHAHKVQRMRFSDKATELWVRKYPRLSAEVPGLLGAIISRAEAQVLRIAVIYALLDCSRFIDKKHLRAALAVWRYCADSARNIFGDALGDRLADDLLSALRKRPDGMTRTEMREFFNRNRTENEITGALDALAGYGLVRCVSEETGGRPAERWFTAK